MFPAYFFLVAEKKKEVTHIIDSNQIVGEPILVPEDEPKAEDEIKPQPKDVLSANSDHSTIEKNVTKTLEGIVVQGKIRTDDQNATDIENIERLPLCRKEVTTSRWIFVT